MQLYFVRHTTVEVAKGLCYGHSEVPLAASFSSEADKVLGAFTESLQTVISSPSERCQRLAKLFSPNYHVDHRIMEMNFGDWELKNWDDLNDSYAMQWMNDYYNLACPNGESFNDLTDRFHEFFAELQSNQEDAIIITHGGIIRAAYHIIRQTPINKLFELKVDFGSIHHFEL